MLLPVALIAANIGLDITEPYCWFQKVANLLLPLGLYAVLTSIGKRVGLTVWLMLPFMILAAFQIVLSFLFGDSVIAVDMFLNVATTNPDEAGELLANLVSAIITVCVIYVPILVWGTISLVRRQTLDRQFRQSQRLWGWLLMCVGGAFAVGAWVYDDEYSFERETFPLNVIENLGEAVHRTRQMRDYPTTSKDFTYNARSERPADEKETYILVIGETARAENWHLFGYDRQTTPRLSAHRGIFPIGRAISESNTTHKSVPMLLSSLSAETFADSITRHKSIITAFNEAGYRTSFFSNQRPNRSYTEYFGDEAHRVEYLPDGPGGVHALDFDLLEPVAEVLADTAVRKQFVVVHTYGSHFLYRDRYPRRFAKFLPDDAFDATKENRDKLINAYDNCQLYTDALLDSLIAMAEARGGRAALIYASDHGEDIFDDSHGRFLHASPRPSARQLHVPALVWLSDTLQAESPRQAEAIRANTLRRVSPQKAWFHTLMGLAEISTPYRRDSLSLASPDYTPLPPVYLTDLNEAVDWKHSGLRPDDMERLIPLTQSNP